MTRLSDTALSSDPAWPERLFAQLPAGVRGLVQASLSRGMLPSALVAQIAADAGMGLEQVMIALLPVAAAHAQTPISGFAVGAVALGLPRAGGPGNLYLGANLEIAGQVLCLTIHAEQSAVNAAWLHGEQGIAALAVDSPPCGLCRQFLRELPEYGMVKLITGQDGGTKAARGLGPLLPEAFGPSELGVQGRLMAAEDHGFTIDTADPLVLAALAACNASYAPYTGAYAGVALRLPDGSIHAGRYAENAAYNPSLLAIQSALAGLRMRRGPDQPAVVADAVLVERSPAPTSQLQATRLILESLGVTSGLRYFAL
jgi:cytidine deaminase